MEMFGHNKLKTLTKNTVNDLGDILRIRLIYSGIDNEKTGGGG